MKTACFILAALLSTQAYAQKISASDIGGVFNGVLHALAEPAFEPLTESET